MSVHTATLEMRRLAVLAVEWKAEQEAVALSVEREVRVGNQALAELVGAVEVADVPPVVAAGEWIRVVRRRLRVEILIQIYRVERNRLAIHRRAPLDLRRGVRRVAQDGEEDLLAGHRTRDRVEIDRAEWGNLHLREQLVHALNEQDTRRTVG